ncbi:Uncharacterised protein [Chlamydia abortus]|uniref:DNA mimic protein DMP19 C-terminal domain-containing protein n=1 Tax=Paenibacillus residui TaxID=629724 RepID=A0ABW3DEK5_9BACL|nr:Uncharacterised protein [Chlamydia abortus]
MNFIDEVLSNISVMSADDVIQSMFRIYDEPVDRDALSAYPQFIQDIIWIIDMDTELAMNGIGGLMGNSTGHYADKMIDALRHISADKEAETLTQIYQIYQSDLDDEKIDELAGSLYLYTDFDIWPLLEAYVEAEKGRLQAPLGVVLGHLSQKRRR